MGAVRQKLATADRCLRRQRTQLSKFVIGSSVQPASCLARSHPTPLAGTQSRRVTQIPRRPVQGSSALGNRARRGASISAPNARSVSVCIGKPRRVIPDGIPTNLKRCEACQRPDGTMQGVGASGLRSDPGLVCFTHVIAGGASIQLHTRQLRIGSRCTRQLLSAAHPALEVACFLAVAPGRRMILDQLGWRRYF